MSLINIPIYGKPLTYTEDQYDITYQASGLSFSNNMPSASTTYNAPTYPQEVTFSCPNKNVRIMAPLGGKLKLSSSSEWDEMFGGGLGNVAGGVIGTVNNALQWAKGNTLQQPWMNRKIYKNTKPFTFTLPLTFVTPIGQSSKEWVAKPTMALMSLLYPRKGGASLSNAVESKTGYNSKGTDVAGNDHSKSLIGSAINLCDTYFIPGPSLRSTMESASDGDRGDYVIIMAGNMFNFGLCYVNSVDIEYSDSFDPEGFPLAASVNVQATCQDAVYCDEDGNFNVRTLGNNAENLSKFLDATRDTAVHTTKNIQALFKDTVGFYQGSNETIGG